MAGTMPFLWKRNVLVPSVGQQEEVINYLKIILKWHNPELSNQFSTIFKGQAGSRLPICHVVAGIKPTNFQSRPNLWRNLCLIATCAAKIV